MSHDFKTLVGKPYFQPGKWWVSPWNFVDEVQQNIINRNVYIHDVTLRDGEQSPGIVFTEDERVRIAEALAEVGVQRIEVGMPIVSEAIRRSIKRILDLKLPSLAVGFCRAHKDDIDFSRDCGLKTVMIEHCTNPYTNENVYGLSKEAVIERLVSTILYAKEQGMEASFMGWDLTRGDDFDYLKDIYQAVATQTKPYSVTLVDTLGVASPSAIKAMIKTFKKWLPDTRLEFHVHNEFGFATAAVMAAVEAGAEGVHTAFNGIGERTGNVATEEVAMALKLLMGIDVGLNLEKIMSTAGLIADLSKRNISPTKPIVGSALFDVETGVAIHVAKKLRDKGFDIPTAAFESSVVGGPKARIVLGKNSGTASIEMFLENYGMSANADQVNELVERVKRESIMRKGLVSEEIFKQMVKDVIGEEST